MRNRWTADAGKDELLERCCHPCVPRRYSRRRPARPGIRPILYRQGSGKDAYSTGTPTNRVPDAGGRPRTSRAEVRATTGENFHHRCEMNALTTQSHLVGSGIMNKLLLFFKRTYLLGADSPSIQRFCIDTFLTCRKVSMSAQRLPLQAVFGEGDSVTGIVRGVAGSRGRCRPNGACATVVYKAEGRYTSSWMVQDC